MCHVHGNVRSCAGDVRWLLPVSTGAGNCELGLKAELKLIAESWIAGAELRSELRLYAYIRLFRKNPRGADRVRRAYRRHDGCRGRGAAARSDHGDADRSVEGQEGGGGRGAAAKPTGPKAGKKVPAKNLAIFVRQFSVMIDAGLPLVQCLEILGKQEPHKNFAAVILKTREDVESGAALADAMKKHPKTFDPLFTNMIAAGEAGGILDTILKRLAEYIEKSVKLNGEVKSAMIYPVAVIVIAGIVVSAILWKVIPTFAALFAGLGAQLPLPTRVVIALSNMLVALRLDSASSPWAWPRLRVQELLRDRARVGTWSIASR